MHLFHRTRYRSSVFAPYLPPPPGGIVSINALLRKIFSSSDVGFFQPINKFCNPFLFPLALNLFNYILLLRVIFSTRYKGKILFFSSSGLSFVEKVAWATTTTLFGRRPIVFLVSGSFPTSWSNSTLFIKTIVSFLFNRPSICLLSQSLSWQNYYKKIFPLCNHRIAPATVDLNNFTQKHKVSPIVKIPKLTYVGWIIKEKGILDLLDATKIASNVYPSLHLDLIGPDFNTKAFWQNEINARDLAANVTLRGSIEDKNKLLLQIVESTIFIFPSHFEGLPVSLIEAISLGIPCISTNVGGCSDVLDYGKAGIIVKVSSPLELSSAIIKLIESHDLRCFYSNAAANHFEEKFSFSNFKMKFSKILL